ncbi:hypothetical protein AAZX31_01G078500 [Glycine max]
MRLFMTVASMIFLWKEGYKFTWTKSKRKPDEIEEKLDRALANLDWLDMFPDFKLKNFIASKSDHSPIHLLLDANCRKSFRKQFRFENSRSQFDLCRREMGQLREASYEDSANCYNVKKDKLNNLIAQEESCWKQREKVYWLREDEMNSRFFHSYASARKKINTIVSLTHDDGMVVTNHK